MDLGNEVGHPCQMEYEETPGGVLEVYMKGVGGPTYFLG